MSFTLKKHDSNKSQIRELADTELAKVSGGTDSFAGSTVTFTGQAGQQTTIDEED